MSKGAQLSIALMILVFVIFITALGAPIVYRNEYMPPMQSIDIATEVVACELLQMNNKFFYNSDGQVILVQCVKPTI